MPRFIQVASIVLAAFLGGSLGGFVAWSEEWPVWAAGLAGAAASAVVATIFVMTAGFVINRD